MIRAAQKIVKDQNAEEGIGRDSELQFVIARRGADSIQSVEIEIHCHASVFDDHLLKCPACPWLSDNFLMPPKAFGPLAGARQRVRTTGARDR